jgi:hypothetical protein
LIHCRKGLPQVREIEREEFQMGKKQSRNDLLLLKKRAVDWKLEPEPGQVVERDQHGP